MRLDEQPITSRSPLKICFAPPMTGQTSCREYTSHKRLHRGCFSSRNLAGFRRMRESSPSRAQRFADTHHIRHTRFCSSRAQTVHGGVRIDHLMSQTNDTKECNLAFPRARSISLLAPYPRRRNKDRGSMKCPVLSLRRIWSSHEGPTAQR